MGMTDHHGKPSLLSLIGYLILAAAVVFALWATAQNSNHVANERAQRSVELNLYLSKQCVRDKRKDAIFIGILRDSIAGAQRRRGLDPAVVRAYVSKQRANIAAIQAVDRQCVADIPPPLPKHNT